VIRTLFAAAALTLAASPALANENERSFTRDGITYTYTSTKVDDALVLEGTARPLGGKFRFVVRDGKVTGYAGNVKVAFLVQDAVKARKLLAAR
jgi:hypothetical protein